MNLNKMFVFIFVFFIMFSALLVTMPTFFKLLGVEADVQDKEARDFFNAQDVLMYNYTVTVNLTYPGSVSEDYGLLGDEKLQFWWDEEYVLGYSVGAMLELRHTNPSFMGWWTEYHRLSVREPYATQGGVSQSDVGLKKAEVLALFDEDADASYCEFACDHLDVKIFIVSANASWTLEESWDNGELKLFTSYSIDWSATGTSMWTIMFQLLAFQNPELGIPGIGGTILTLGFGGALWACIAILAFALITAVIPFIGGWGGGD